MKHARAAKSAGLFLALFWVFWCQGGAVQAASTWRAIADSRPFNAVWMADDSEGWAVATGGGISRTTDGGDTWEPVNSGVTVTLRGVWGTTMDNVWAVGDAGTILRWNGTAWSVVAAAGVKDNLNAIHGTGAASIWAVGANASILRWDGSAWVVQNVPNGVNDDLYGVWAAPNGTAMAVGERGRGLRYNGTAWANQATGAGNSVNMLAVWGTAANSIWAVGTAGEIRFWNGTAWAAQSSGVTSELNGVQGASASQVWAVGRGGVVRFFNGTAWSGQTSNTNQDLLALDVISGTEVIAVGNRRTVAIWDGSSWDAEIAALPNVPFPAIWAADDDRVWFGGGNGLILRWDGSQFINTPSGTNRAINAMWGADHNNIWAVGSNGTILKWNGSAWTAQTSGVTEALNGVWGTSATQVWAVGNNGTILRWNGSAWSQQTSGVTENLFAVWARDGSNVWAVGQRGVIRKWTGSAWTAQTSGVNGSLVSVWGAGSSVWAGGAAGTILKLSGSTWSRQTSGATASVAALTGTSTTAIWAGAGAEILNSNGTTWSPDGATGVGLNIIGAFALSPAAIYLTTNSGVLLTNQPAQVPQITVEVAGSGINTGEGVVDFGAVEVLQNAAQTFTLRNTGTLPLNGLALSKDGAHAVDFTPGSLAVASLNPGESTTFSVTFAPSNKGTRTANIRVASDDPTEPSFLIQVSGTGFYVPVTITDNPQPAAAALGAPVVFNVSATGTELIKYQWRKNGASISGATASTYTVPAAAATHAGTYTVVVSNPDGSKTSAGASLTVVDTAVKVIALPTGGTFQTSPPVTGAVTGYLWKQNGGPMPSDPRYTGWAGKTLKIAKLIESDAGDYSCDVITAGGTLTTTARLIVYNAKPVIHTPGPAPEDPIVMSEAIVGGNYFWLLPIDGDPLLTPTSFTATGLPAGLVINKTNGVVSGVPKVALTAAKDYAVTFTASNAKGKATAKATLRLHPLPANTTGTYAGPVAREGGFYSGLGGRVDLTIQSTGAYSGKLLLAGTSLSFKGSLNTALGSLYPTATTAIKRKNLPDLVVRFTVDTANHRLTDAELDDGSVTPAFTAWRSRWGTAMPAEDLAALQAFIGQFNLALLPAVGDPNSHPQGAGFASFKVAATGRLTVSGKVADGTAFTCASFAGPLGEVLVYRQLYLNKGSVSGHVTATAGTAPVFADSGIAGTLQWSRPAQNSRTYRSGFGPVDLTAVGGRYLPPAATVPPMELTDSGPGLFNAALAFTSGGIEDTFTGPDIQARLQAGGKVELPLANPTLTKLTLANTTGAANGSFKLVDQNPAVPGTNMTRSVTFQSLIVRDAGVLRAYGFFLLPKRPGAGTTEKTTTTDILSGRVDLTPLP